MSALGSQQQKCLEFLLELKAPSRLGAKDASLFAIDPNNPEHTEERLGWATLSSKPPFPISEMKRYAEEIRAEGLDGVVLIGQGGSSQAAMTITKLAELSGRGDVPFKTMDSLSPVFVDHILGSSDPAKTLYLVSSKSGSTMEIRMLERVVWQYAVDRIGEAEAARRFVALTDPGSGLEQLAREKGYRYIIPTPADVGGRFSALTPFALFPTALIGIDIEQVIAEVCEVELNCTSDSPDNRALKLACFLYNAFLEGRDKFSMVLPAASQVFGLWVEQLVAESLGKEGKGILPNIEVDASILAVPRTDRSAIIYHIGEDEGFAESLAAINTSIPALSYRLEGPQEAFSHFVIWEYAVAFLGILLEVYPFDQPDVEVTKRLVRELLSKKEADSEPPDSYQEARFDKGIIQSISIGNALALESLDEQDGILRSLFASLEQGDYFSLNAFLPFRCYGRREALERMRNRVASRKGVVSSLQIGPRFLHSTGQFHKGGPNTGVFLVLSSGEGNDIRVPGEDLTLGELAKAQAQGDFAALASRGRRVLHVHLSDNSPETLSHFADRVCCAISATTHS
ncbi:MAG: glucose-6-phosphate isomerase [Coriobacteriia bacterium]|nr:glucose-6-phosphate isomerase [Coriobacteriia bacterium]